MISNKGFLAEQITLNVTDDTTSGVVTLDGNNTCKAAEAGDSFIGVMVNCRKDIAGVQVKGYVEVSYSGDAIAPGIERVVADGIGGIKKDANGREIIVLSVNSTDNTAEIIL